VTARLQSVCKEAHNARMSVELYFNALNVFHTLILDDFYNSNFPDRRMPKVREKKQTIGISLMEPHIPSSKFPTAVVKLLDNLTECHESFEE
jgi:hypothetical protein